MTADDIQVERIEAGARAADIGIVHLGLGAFHRAHQAVYLERFRQTSGERGWGIASANLRSNVELVDALAEAGYRYHVVESADAAHVTLREVAAIQATYFTGEQGGYWGRDLQSLLDRMADPAIAIVTLTVTEKGYFLSPADGELRLDDPQIAHDIAHPEVPRTAPGILCAALARRREAGGPGFTVLCCDNIPANGERTKAAVVTLARQTDAGLADWIVQHVSFPSSMVDRIVPAVTDADRARLAELGLDDPNAVVCEAFSQWVVEDDFVAGRPAWESVDVQMVEDVTPFETMKLRMLNGAHSLLAYVGGLAGIETVAEAVARDDIAALLRGYMRDEAAPTLAMPAGVDLADYRERLLARFANDSLAHRLQQIAADGSQKLPQRWLTGAQIQLAGGGPIKRVALGVAAWIRYMAGTDLAGVSVQVSDPMAERLAACHSRYGEEVEALVDAVLADRDVFSARLSDEPAFRDAVIGAYRRLSERGVAVALADLADAPDDA
ncbi:mannitol dehydrogenase family protein [Salinisphaera sp. SWV1]|uniref:mannitol dehydrogenase family protein n=1 Tax=Salinisphaera sp. SWV1 TaxID=3454139 RepID=UPI003F8730CC